MVKFRGIEICVVSQFDIRRLPEFAHRTSPVGEFNATSATCYIPIYPGSQIWFEYTIDGPHPPNAAYFFKLFINNHFITSWDCTTKYGYSGKTSYCLQVDNQEVQRQGFQFTNVEEDDQKLISLQDDCIEIRVYRIEHRQRVPLDHQMAQETYSTQAAGKLKLVSGGTLEPGRPQRRYKYQLLDPLDVPHARFRFFYRDYEWLETHGLLHTTPTTDEPADSSVLWFDPTLEEAFESSPSGHGSPDYAHPWITTPERSPSYVSPRKENLSPPKQPILQATNIPSETRSPDPPKRQSDNPFFVLNKSDDSLSLLTKGSIEDLHSTVPRSPQSVRSTRSNLALERKLPEIPDSPHYSPPRPGVRGSPSTTTDTITETVKGRRPLSPFTSGGFLRKIRSPTPPMVPQSLRDVMNMRQVHPAASDDNDNHGCGSTGPGAIMKYLSRQMHKRSPKKGEIGTKLS